MEKIKSVPVQGTIENMGEENVRLPVVAGRFYAGSEDSLREQIENCFTDPHGPGKIPKVEEGPRKIAGLVSPHAGYPYSGPVAAHGFSKLASDGKPETVIIVGPNHSGMGTNVSVDTSDFWKTPLGTVPVNKETRDEIVERSEVIELDSRAHSREHSIEVQIPFLQYLFGDDFQIVPICMRTQNISASREIGEAIAKAIDEETLIVASTDLTHYESQKAAEEKDREAIEKMKGLDWEGLVKLVSEKSLSVCGYGPVASTILASKNAGAKKGELFKYATSGDTAGPSNQVVGYCSLGIWKA